MSRKNAIANPKAPTCKKSAAQSRPKPGRSPSSNGNLGEQPAAARGSQHCASAPSFKTCEHQKLQCQRGHVFSCPLPPDSAAMTARSPESVQSSDEQSSQVVSPIRDDDSPSTKRMKSLRFGFEEGFVERVLSMVFKPQIPIKDLLSTFPKKTR